MSDSPSEDSLLDAKQPYLSDDDGTVLSRRSIIRWQLKQNETEPERSHSKKPGSEDQWHSMLCFRATYHVGEPKGATAQQTGDTVWDTAAETAAVECRPEVWRAGTGAVLDEPGRHRHIDHREHTEHSA